MVTKVTQLNPRFRILCLPNEIWFKLSQAIPAVNSTHQFSQFYFLLRNHLGRMVLMIWPVNLSKRYKDGKLGRVDELNLVETKFMDEIFVLYLIRHTNKKWNHETLDSPEVTVVQGPFV